MEKNYKDLFIQMDADRGPSDPYLALSFFPRRYFKYILLFPDQTQIEMVNYLDPIEWVGKWQADYEKFFLSLHAEAEKILKIKETTAKEFEKGLRGR